MAGRQSGATERALDRIRMGENPHAAARTEGINPSTIYRALKRQRKQQENRR